MSLSSPAQAESKDVMTRKSENPLDRLTNSLADDLSAVNSIILARMQSDVALIPELAGHLIAAGGKRIRPLMTLASAALFGYNGTRQHRLAACVEFIHTATLLHDDVVDESDQRRGKASANAIFGNEAAVLVGDFLFSRAFQLMVEDGSLEVLRVLSNASAVIAEGEVLQLATTRNIETSKDDYTAVVTAKTAELFAAACEVGAIVAARPQTEINALRDFGINLGIAFQIVDDVLDYGAGSEKLGKALGDDFREGKVTAPVVLALAAADETEKTFWQRTLGDLDQNDDDFDKAREILNKHQAIDRAIKMARDYAEKGRMALSACPKNDVRDNLQDLLAFTVERDF